jgi:hypothetical protein
VRLAHSVGRFALADGPRIAWLPPFAGAVPEVVAPVVPDVVAPLVPDVVAPVDPDVDPAVVALPAVPDDVPDDVCALADTANASAIALARAHLVKVVMSNSLCLSLATPDSIEGAMLARVR